MKSILTTVLLLVVIIVLYEATIGGESGAGRILEERGSRLQDEIGGIDP